MKTRTLTKALLAAGIASAIFTAQAADLRVNGFASVVGGKALSEGKTTASAFAAPGIFDQDARYQVAPVFSADAPERQFEIDADILQPSFFIENLEADLVESSIEIDFALKEHYNVFKDFIFVNILLFCDRSDIS